MHGFEGALAGSMDGLRIDGECLRDLSIADRAVGASQEHRVWTNVNGTRFGTSRRRATQRRFLDDIPVASPARGQFQSPVAQLAAGVLATSAPCSSSSRSDEVTHC